MSTHRTVAFFGTSLEYQLVPLNEVEIVLAANFASQLLIAVGTAVMPKDWQIGIGLLAVGVLAYAIFVIRKYANWRERRVPLETVVQSTVSSGSLVKFNEQ